MKSAPQTKYFTRSRARVVLHLLGVNSIQELFRLSGVSASVIEDLLLYKPRRRVRVFRVSTFLKLFETFRELYDEKRSKLEPDLRKMVKTYICRWARYMIERDIAVSRVGGQRDTSRHVVQDRLRRTEKRRQKYRAMIKDFCC